MREPRRTRAPLPPRAAPAAPAPRGGPVWSLATSADLPVLAPQRTWQAQTTPSFRVLHFGARVAPIVAQQAELARTAILARWIGAAAAAAPWRPRCQVALYDTRAELRTMTGGDPKLGSAAARSAQLTPGRMLERRIDLAADDAELLSATLPHEIAHIVVRDALGGKPPPLWANEGLAMLCEAAEVQQRYGAHLAQARARGQAYPLETLFAMREYPAELRHKWVFYAQSHSVAAYLVSRGGEQRFISFLVEALRSGPARALSAVYAIPGIAALSAGLEQAASAP